MITDRQNTPSGASPQSATTGTQVSTDTIDLGLARDISRGADLRAVVSVTTAYSGGTSIDFQIIQSAAADLSSPTVLASTGAIAAATLVAGFKPIDMVIPPNTQRYIGFRTVVVGTFSAGAHVANVVSDSDSGRHYTANTGF